MEAFTFVAVATAFCVVPYFFSVIRSKTPVGRFDVSGVEWLVWRVGPRWRSALPLLVTATRESIFLE